MFEQTFKNIDDVLWKEAGCTTELDYTEQTSWMLFLKYLDDLEQEHALKAELVGRGVGSRDIDRQNLDAFAELNHSILHKTLSGELSTARGVAREAVPA